MPDPSSSHSKNITYINTWYLYFSNQSVFEGFSGDYYTGDTKYYWSSGVVQFWYLETKDGIPVEQGEGCSQPGVQKREACAYEAPIMLYHDYDPKSFIPESHSASEFDLPDVCKNTKVSCAAPGNPCPHLDHDLGHAIDIKCALRWRWYFHKECVTVFACAHSAWSHVWCWRQVINLGNLNSSCTYIACSTLHVASSDAPFT